MRSRSMGGVRSARLTRRARWFGASPQLVLAGLLALAGLGILPLRAGGSPAAANDNTNTILHLGFSSSMFAGVNENDARAAMKVWARNILLEHGVDVLADTVILGGDAEIAAALQSKRIDSLTLTTPEYRTLRGQWTSTNAVIGSTGGDVTQEYLLLAHRDSPISRAEDLKGRSVAFYQQAQSSLAPVWFETLLLKAGLGTTSRCCGRVVQAAKLSQAVLPVFFRQLDACVVSRRGFQTMAELNPQVGQRLKILATSPAMVPVVFVFRADFTGPVRDQILAEIVKVRSTVASQQVLTLFQAENLEVRPVSCTDTAMELLETHARLLAADLHGALARTNSPVASAKEERP